MRPPAQPSQHSGERAQDEFPVFGALIRQRLDEGHRVKIWQGDTQRRCAAFDNFRVTEFHTRREAVDKIIGTRTADPIEHR